MFSIHDRLTPMNQNGAIPVNKLNEEQIAVLITGDGKCSLYDCKSSSLFSDAPQLPQEHHQSSNNNRINYHNTKSPISTSTQSQINYSERPNMVFNQRTANYPTHVNYHKIEATASTSTQSPNNYPERPNVVFNQSAANCPTHINYHNIEATASTSTRNLNPERLTMAYNNQYSATTQPPFALDGRIPYCDYNRPNVPVGYLQSIDPLDQRLGPNNYGMNQPSTFNPSYPNRPRGYSNFGNGPMRRPFRRGRRTRWRNGNYTRGQSQHR